jgi:hypothetical protein
LRGIRSLNRLVLVPSQPSRVFRVQAFSVEDAQKIKYERNYDDGAKYAQATTHAPSRMTVVASTDAEEQQ